jgi:hypothetical protein
MKDDVAAKNYQCYKQVGPLLPDDTVNDYKLSNTLATIQKSVRYGVTIMTDVLRVR